jgi:2-polyprenyl-3-methyl-5-hydroxy-6-metoxy-1,4-benzoquinol methylase
MPLANGLLKSPDEPEEKYPLDLVFCPDCTLVQLTGNVDPDKMFKDYKYYSSGSQTMLKSAADLVEKTTANEGLNKDSLVIEIASNDGYLLKNYVESGIPVQGIDPCLPIAMAAQNKNNVPTMTQYFSLELAKRLLKWEHMQADVIHANNIMAHLPDLNDVVEGISILLKPNGIAIIETPYIRDMIDNCEFDTIYHEHLCYYSLTALSRLFNRYGLSVVDVEHLSIHGGSLRVTVSHNAERYI